MSGIFSSIEMYEARDLINRSDEDSKRLSDELYNILKKDILLAQANTRRDYITYTLERKIGKSYNLLKLASEYNYPLVVYNLQCAKIAEREAKRFFNKKIKTLTINQLSHRLERCDCNVLLKDDMVDIVKLRDKLVTNRMSYINIVGIN